MKRQSILTPLSLAGLLAFGACSSDAPTDVTPSLPTEPVFSQGQAPPITTDRHLFLFNEGTPISAAFAAQVEAAGGTLVRTHPAIGMAVTRGLTDAAAQAIGGASAVAARDVMLQWAPTLEEARGTIMTLPQGTGIQSHNPGDAPGLEVYQWNMKIIRAHEAWNAGFRGIPGVKVAIIDTGLDPFHQELAGLIDEANSVAFTPSLNPAGPDWGDDHWHGTHVAGTVVTNGIYIAGVAPHVTLVAVKVLNARGGGFWNDIIAGIVHAADVGADVINLSLGGAFPKNYPGAGQLVAALNRAVNYAQSKGTLVVSAAGNWNVDLQRFGNWTWVPCQSGAGMCISATGPTDLKASYSNFGTNTINVAAPGGDFWVSQSWTDVVIGPCSTLGLCSGQSGVYVFAHGTSMAAPHVAGLAALLDSQHGGSLNAAQLRTRIEQAAVDLGKPGADPIYGKGRVDVCATLGC